MVRRIEKRKRIEEEGELQTSVRPVEIPFHQLINAMLDGSTPLPPRYLYRLSDLADDDYYQLKKHWNSIPVWRRQAMMDDLQELVEKDLMLSFESVARMALNDEDARVRFGAVKTLIANEAEAPDLVEVYLRMMQDDPDPKVRAIATSALGHFVYLGELETIQADVKRDLEDRLLDVYRNGNEPEIQYCALEALGFSNRDEIPPLIEEAYNSTESSLQTSSLVAMGRSSHERWKPQVMTMLTHSNPGIRTEAARAAGELGISEARPHLFDLIEDANQDVCAASLWALSQIGGKGVRKILQERLQEADEDEEIKFLESAIDNLDFNEGNHGLDIIDLEEASGEQLYPVNAEGDDDEIDADELFDYDDDDDYFDDDELEDDEEYGDFLDEEEDDEDFYFEDDDDDDDDEDLWH